MADRVFRDLHKNLVAGLQRQFDTACGVAVRRVFGGGIPIDLAGVEHRIASTPDVNEGGFHARQHVLYAAEIDVTDQRGVLVLGDVVFHEYAVFDDADLNFVLRGTHNHDPVNGLAAGEKLGLGNDRPAAPGITAVAAALLLGLEPGGTLDALRFGDQFRFARSSNLDDGVLRVILSSAALVAAAATCTATDGRGRLLLVVIVVEFQLGAVPARRCPRGQRTDVGCLKQ